MSEVKQELSQLIAGEVRDDALSLDKVSRDTSLFDITPSLLVSPKDSSDICQLVKFVNNHPDEKLSLTARSGGTDMTGGPLTKSIVVDVLKHFNRVIEIGDHYAITQPGVFYRDFEKETLKKDLLLPCYPASREICTVGGMAANNSGGEKTLAYGKTEDYIEELNIVLADGNEYTVKPLTKEQLDKKIKEETFEGRLYKKIYKLITDNYDVIMAAKPHVTKNSAGYYLWNVWDGKVFNLCKLIVGSQGTFGIITRVKYRLITPKKHSRMLIIFLKDLSHLTAVVEEVLKFKPESFESFDDHTLKLAVRFAPEMAKIMKTGFIKLGWDLIPEAWTILKMGRVPKLMLMAEFTGDDVQEVQARTDQAQSTVRALRLPNLVTHSEKEGKKYWVIRRQSFNLLRHHVQKMHTAPFIDDIIVSPPQMPEFLPKLEKIMAKYNLTYTIAGHVGDANFHIIPIMKLDDPKTKKIVPELSKKVYELVISFHGSITGEHNDGLIRSPFLREMYGARIYKLFEETKNIFDPNNIFNPGKKVHASLSYALSHFIKDEDAS